MLIEVKRLQLKFVTSLRYSHQGQSLSRSGLHQMTHCNYEPVTLKVVPVWSAGLG